MFFVLYFIFYLHSSEPQTSGEGTSTNQNALQLPVESGDKVKVETSEEKEPPSESDISG